MLYDGKIILAAHRGDRKICPENTMPAFYSAIENNVDMIETDIHLTADGELIIRMKQDFRQLKEFWKIRNH